MAKPFNKEQLQELIRMLRVARRNIKKRRFGAICPDLWRQASGRSTQCLRLADYLTDWISEMLGESPYLDSWLVRNGHIDDFSVFGSCWEHRLAWIDWMVKELEREIRALDAAATKPTADERFRIAA